MNTNKLEITGKVESVKEEVEVVKKDVGDLSVKMKAQENINLTNLKIFPINISRENLEKSQNFFKELNIKNLDIYFDSPITLAKKFSLRGVPTSILFDKEGKEFARIIGSVDFNNKEFINWLKSYN